MDDEKIEGGMKTKKDKIMQKFQNQRRQEERGKKRKRKEEGWTDKVTKGWEK